MRHPYVTDDMIEAFATDGVVLLPEVLDSTWMDLAEMGLTRNLRNPGAHHQLHYGGTPRAFIDDYCNYWAIPEYRIACGALAHNAHRCIGSAERAVVAVLRPDLRQGRPGGRGPAHAVASRHHLLDHWRKPDRRLLDHFGRHTRRGISGAVSYTHLTLPTNDAV